MFFVGEKIQLWIFDEQIIFDELTCLNMTCCRNAHDLFVNTDYYNRIIHSPIPV